MIRENISKRKVFCIYFQSLFSNEKLAYRSSRSRNQISVQFGYVLTNHYYATETNTTNKIFNVHITAKTKP